MPCPFTKDGRCYEERDGGCLNECYHAQRRENKQVLAVQAILKERQFQDQKHGHPDENPHTIGAWILVLEAELAEAKAACIKGGVDRNNVISEIVQVAATAVACLEQWGTDPIEGRTV